MLMIFSSAPKEMPMKLKTLFDAFNSSPAFVDNGQYMIISKMSISDLEVTVTKYLAEGWLPLGGAQTLESKNAKGEQVFIFNQTLYKS